MLSLGYIGRTSSTAVETPYGLLTLEQTRGEVVLRMNGIVQSRYVPAFLDRGYLLSHRSYFELLPYLRPGRWRALNVGLGAGLVPRCLAFHGIRSESIEVNPVLTRLVQRHLAYEMPVRVGDGRRWIRRLEDKYDFVLLDVFHGESPATHLMTVEAFQEVRERLTETGIVCIHLIGGPSTPVTASVARTLREAFPELLCVQSGIGNELQHLYLFASAAPMQVPDHPELERAAWLGNEVFTPDLTGSDVLTDDRNALEIMNLPLARLLRVAQRQVP